MKFNFKSRVFTVPYREACHWQELLEHLEHRQRMPCSYGIVQTVLRLTPNCFVVQQQSYCVLLISVISLCFIFSIFIVFPTPASPFFFDIDIYFIFLFYFFQSYFFLVFFLFFHFLIILLLHVSFS